MIASTNRFDLDYAEKVKLRDGTAITVRAVRPSDKEMLRKGFERLSPESRYRRFFSVKHALSEDELDYFTRLDGANHFALGATRRLADGTEEGLGVARFVRLPEDPECAEAAVAVIDDFQGHGIGRALLERLIAAAEERGIHRFRSEVLADNAPVRTMLKESGAKLTESAAEGVLLVDVDLTGFEGHEPRRTPAHGVLSAAAEGLARFRLPGLFRRRGPSTPAGRS